MKRFVNGAVVELEPSGAEISASNDRLFVRMGGSTSTAIAIRSNDQVLVSYQGRQFVIEKATHSKKTGQLVHSGEIRSPMPGAIVDVLVAMGDKVEEGQKLVVLEAMKTQQSFSSPFDGVVSQVNIEKGSQVGEGDLLITVDRESE